MRKGRQMMRAVAVVKSHPGCSKKYVAEVISPCPQPNKNWALGYNPVNRAIQAGLIRVEQSGGRYRLYVD